MLHCPHQHSDLPVLHRGAQHQGHWKQMCEGARVQARCYLNKLPERLTAEDRILVVDPMLATGERGCCFVHEPWPLSSDGFCPCLCSFLLHCWCSSLPCPARMALLVRAGCACKAPDERKVRAPQAAPWRCCWRT